MFPVALLQCQNNREWIEVVRAGFGERSNHPGDKGELARLWHGENRNLNNQ